MWLRQLLVLGLTLVIAVMTQSAFLSRLGLPGATPDLIVVTVVAIALAYGPAIGIMYGFVAGLLVDFAPSTQGIIGVNALLYMGVAYATGRALDPRDRTVPLTMALVAAACGGVILARAVVDSVLGQPTVIWDEVPTLVVTGAIYGAFLAPLVVMPVGWVVKKFTPEVAL